MSPIIIHFPADHPTAAGHFPGRPMIPGAVLLDVVLDSFARAAGRKPSLIKSAKFFSPVIPGTSVLVGWQSASPDTIKFAIHQAEGNTLVASGLFEVSAS
jgi:3-hydroxymyristoyl/3-hydroxydecanoyl-(acyl carrier protein) dehydratase